MTLSLTPVWTHKYLKDGFAPVCKFSKNPTDSIIAAGYGDGKIMVYNYDKGSTVSEIGSHLFAVNDIDWSPHYNYLLSGSDDTLALMHDLNIQSASKTDDEGFTNIYEKEKARNVNLEKSLVRVFQAHTNHVTSVKFDTGSSLALTGSLDRVCYLWDVRSAQYIHKIEDHAMEIYGVDISQDGNLILTAGKDGFVRLWETRTGLCLKTIKIDLTSRVGECFFTPDSKAIIANNVDQGISAYDVENAKLIKRYGGHNISSGYYLKHCVHQDNDETYILSGGEDGCIYGWSILDSEPVFKSNILEASLKLNIPESEGNEPQAEIKIPGESDTSKAIISCVNSSAEKGLIGCVDSYRNVHVAKLTSSI